MGLEGRRGGSLEKQFSRQSVHPPRPSCQHNYLAFVKRFYVCCGIAMEHPILKLTFWVLYIVLSHKRVKNKPVEPSVGGGNPTKCTSDLQQRCFSKRLRSASLSACPEQAILGGCF